MLVWYFLFALAAGAMLPFQAGINAQLSHWLDSPIRAAFAAFVVGALALLVLSVLTLKPAPSVTRLAGAPWWIWTGGLLGAFYVTGSITSAPKLGAVTLIALIVAGQAVASLLVDHFGLVGFREHHVSLGRVVGMALVFVGVTLVRVF